MDYNRAILVGRVTADPQVRTTPGGQSVVTLGIATNRTWTDKAGAKQEETEFHSVVVWGRQAEIAGQYLTKGATVLIEGRIQTRSWTDKQGQQRKTTEIMCERLQLGPRAGAGGGGGSSSSGGGFRGGSPSSAGNSSSSSAAGGSAKMDDAPSLDEIPVINLEDEEIKPEDIPF
jgi:single-strand DNA-binding protein